MKRLSIIVPIYNTEHYLLKCLDSLLTQDIPLNDYEIILINDGSTDASVAIARSFMNQHSNIKLISQQNKGIGAARNIGISESEGKYLFFVDSDDYIQPNCLRMLLEYMETEELEILRFNYSPINEKGEVIPRASNSAHRMIHTNNVVDGETFVSDYLGWACYSWIYLLKSDFIKNNHLYFKEEIIFEDIEWLISSLLAAKRVKSIDKNVYYYLQRNGSITKSQGEAKQNKVVTDMLYNLHWLHKQSETADNIKVRLWCKGMIAQSFMGILSYAQKEIPERRKDIIYLLQRDKCYPLKSYHFTFKQWRNMTLLNINPKLFCTIKAARLKLNKYLKCK